MSDQHSDVIGCSEHAAAPSGEEAFAEGPEPLNRRQGAMPISATGWIQSVIGTQFKLWDQCDGLPSGIGHSANTFLWTGINKLR
jgi:hypothetical protein